MLGWAMVAVTMTGVILSLNRNMLLGLALGLCAAALVTPQRHRFVVMAASLVLVVSGFVLIAQGSTVESSAIVSRISSITNYSQLQTQTLNDRYYENHIAIARIRAHPIGGLGWGPNYGALLLTSDDGFLVTQPRPFVQEQYLWIWLRAGFVGLLALIAMLFSASGTGRAGAGRDTAAMTPGWGGGDRGGRRGGGQLERRDLPDTARFDRALGRRARAGGNHAARARPPVSDGGARLDVVVINFHSAPLIGRALAVAREFAGAETHVIVVDNSPGDGAAEIVRWPTRPRR